MLGSESAAQGQQEAFPHRTLAGSIITSRKHCLFSRIRPPCVPHARGRLGRFERPGHVRAGAHRPAERVAAALYRTTDSAGQVAPAIRTKAQVANELKRESRLHKASR